MDGTVFAFDPDWVSTLNAPFMTNAFLAGLCIALAAGVMGYFTIARHSTFAAHALAHIGLPGATGAVLLGLPVSAGLGVFALGGALVIGALGKKASQRETRFRHRPWSLFRTHVKLGFAADAVDSVRLDSDDHRRSDHWFRDFRRAAFGCSGSDLPPAIVQFA